MRLLYLFILGMVFFTSPVSAQEDDLGTATSALQDVLSTLKESVSKLALDNDQLAARDNAMKAQVTQLQIQLGNLETQGDLLNKQAAQLQEKNPRRAQQITRLEQENFDLDDRTQKAEGGIKLLQQSLEAGYREVQKLLLQLKGMSNTLSPVPLAPNPESQAAAIQEKEKLKLMKMIYDSQERQESLHESILDLQKNTPLLPAAGALAHQQLLKEQIKDLEGQLAAYPSEKLSANPAGIVYQWDDTQLRQLELELNTLERNYLQLKVLMGQISKKAQGAPMTVSEQMEGKKLQDSIDQLNNQGEGLKAQLDDLRSQMVDLDKRKSHLEEMIKK